MAAKATWATWAADRERDKVPGLGVRCRNSCNYILNYLTKQLAGFTATNPDTDSAADGDGDGDTAVDSDPEEYEKSKADQQI